MKYCLPVRALAAFVLAAAPALAAASPQCQATARKPPNDARHGAAVEEAQRQHRLFGGQTIERDGGMYHVGHHEAEWSRLRGESTPAWQRVAAFWRALSEEEPASLSTTVGRVTRPEPPPSAEPSRTQLAAREALLRAAIVDTPWSAAFISYLMRSAGFSGDEFVFSESHADYVQAAFETSRAEAEGRAAAHAFRACDIATTRPRPGDLLCATRASSAGTARFDALAVAMAARSGSSQAFPMHCDLVVRSDAGGDAKLEAIGGNVINSVTLSRMTLNARKVLGAAYLTNPERDAACERAGRACRGHLSRRPWVVLLQARH